MPIQKLGSPGGVLLRMDDAITTAPVTTEQTLVTYPVAGSTLNMSNRLRFTFYCTTTTPALLPGTVTIRVKYGSATLALGGGALALLGGANTSPFTISGNLSNKTSTGSQFLQAEIRSPNSGLSLVSPVTQAVSFPTVDSTVDQTFSLSVQLSNALSSLTIQQAEATLD